MKDQRTARNRPCRIVGLLETPKLSLQAELAIGDRVAIIHLHRVGKDRRREAILQKRESLHRLFDEKYSPDVSVFTDGKVEIMFKLTYEQGENLARLMKGQDLVHQSFPAQLRVALFGSDRSLPEQREEFTACALQ